LNVCPYERTSVRGNASLKRAEIRRPDRDASENLIKRIDHIFSGRGNIYCRKTRSRCVMESFKFGDKLRVPL
jgi:hypothetical protein